MYEEIRWGVIFILFRIYWWCSVINGINYVRYDSGCLKKCFMNFEIVCWCFVWYDERICVIGVLDLKF